MKFEWDEDKRLANASKHGIDFRDAARIFEGETLIAHTEDSQVIRIISARKATKYEQRAYFKGIAN